MSDTIVTSINQASEKRLDVLRDESGKLLLTSDQKKAVLERGRILVSASAGSGKTSTMVKRIILMISEGASLKDMLILVYNNAAADELKEKLHQELFRVACASSGEQRERFRREIDDMAFCHICTIHAFCQSLIRENFDKLGLSPTFEVLDESAHAVYMNKALDNVIAAYTAEGDETFCRLVDVFSQSRKEDNLKSNIIRLYNLVEIQPDSEDFKKCVAECYDGFENSKFFGILKDYYTKFFVKAKVAFESARERLVAMDIASVKYIDSVTNAVYTCDAILKAKDVKGMCGVASAYEKPRATLSTKASDEERELIGYVKEYYKQFDDVIEELASLYAKYDLLKEYHKQNGEFVNKLVEAECRFSDELARLKAQDNVLSFEDLQHKAMQLLSEDDTLKDAFDAVFVDEYQDVNPTQEAIISKLVKGECFMVGDVKQSIYGFRLADPSIFISRQKRYAEFGTDEGQNIFFNHNFRSAYGILAFVNGVFDSVMTEENADINYKADARFELKDIPPVSIEDVSPEGYVQVHLFAKNKAESEAASGLYDIVNAESDDDDEGVCQEGEFIANEIKTLVGRMKGTNADGSGKYIGYGDIAVLFRSRSNGAKRIVETLKREGIPVNEGAFGQSASLPERELVSFLRVLDNPRQDVAFAGYLLSFFGGYDEEEVAKIALEEGGCLYDKFLKYALKDDVLAQKVRDTAKTIDKYRLKESYRNLPELMNGIVCDYRYDAYLMRSGEGDVSGLKSFISGAGVKDGITLGKFLEDYCEGTSEGASASGGDRVAISTFHGYKGLENPVVFVADTAFGFNYESSTGDMISTGKGLTSAKNSNDKGLVGMNAFNFDDKTKSAVTLSKIAVGKCIKDNQLKEEIRLFYVALTRAKQLMYVTATASEKKCASFGVAPRLFGAGCDLDFLSGAIFDGSVKATVFKHNFEDEKAQDEEAESVAYVPDEHVVETIRKSQDFVYPYKEATTLAMKYSVSALDSKDEDAVCLFKDAAKKGSAYHKVMQYIDYFAEGKEAVEAEMERMAREKLIDEEERALVNAADIARCLDSEIMQKAKKALMSGSGKCMREQAFMMYKPANEVNEDFSSGDRVLVQGVADLFINDEERIILDFKNSALKDEESLEKYKKQLYLYKSAIESAIGAKIDKLALYSFKTGKTLYL